MNFDDADLLTLCEECCDGVLNRVCAGAHYHNNPLGVWCANVLNQLVGATGDGGKFIHLFLYDRDTGRVELVNCFASLEVNIRVLGGSAHNRTIRGKAAQAVSVDQFVVHHGAHVVEGQLFHFLDFV